jgi:translation initiation factor 5A
MRPATRAKSVQPFPAESTSRARATAPSLTRPALAFLSPRLPLASVQVIEVTTSKTGKHGHAKCHFTATDIFTGKKMEELTPSSHNLEVPIVAREDYTLVDLNDEGFLGLMDDSGNVREDLQLPAGHADAEELAKQIQDAWDEGKELILTVLKSMNQEQVNAMKEAPKAD